MFRASLPILLCTALAVSACGGDPAAGPGTGGPGAFPPTDVQTLTIAPKPIPQTSEFVATVRSLRSTDLQPQVEGIVRRIFVKAGDRVSAGQPIVQIDPDKQQATVTTVRRSASRAKRTSRMRSSSSRGCRNYSRRAP
jgi:multidrug efflux pump subunit AcrA (membrane-fusion protein)